MKKLVLVCCFLTTVFLHSVAQPQSELPPAVKYTYCQLVGTQKFMSTKVTVSLDYGQEAKFFQDTRIRDEVTGKVTAFNSMVDALNYMGNQGWEFVQAYVVTVGQQNVYHWLLKRPE